MKCPKCHYLSFEPEARCRNCGYDLSVPEGDLSLKLDDEARPDEPMVDLALHAVDDPSDPSDPPDLATWAPVASARAGDLAEAPVEPPRRVRASKSSGRAVQAGARGMRAARASAPAATVTPPAESWVPESPPARPVPPTTELPLFVKGLPPEPTDWPTGKVPEAATDPAVTEPTETDPPAIEAMVTEPEVSAPLTPEHVSASIEAGVGDSDGAVSDVEPLLKLYRHLRPPLGVRRQTPVPGRVKAKYSPPASRRLGPFDRDLLEDLQRIEKNERQEAEAQARAAARAAGHSADQADAAARLAAAAVDALVIGGLGAGITWTTLRWCGLPLDRASILPLAPLLAFLLLVGAGYLLMFTAAGGQTIGKMLLGLRVVGGGDGAAGERLSGRQVFFRELLTLPSVLALGAGFLPALVGEGRALHDRIAHTRVVRA
jgi:uncharacterized RDD family membrane protein YckC